MLRNLSRKRLHSRGFVAIPLVLLLAASAGLWSIDHVKPEIMDGLLDKVLVISPFTNPPEPIHLAQGEKDTQEEGQVLGEVLAVETSGQSFDLESFKNEIKQELLKYFDLKISSLTPTPFYINQSSPNVVNYVTRQSDSDSRRISTALSNITDGGTFTNATISGNSISGSSGSFLNLSTNNLSIRANGNKLGDEEILFGDFSLIEGEELVTNGTFTGSATGWTLGTGWGYATNAVNYSPTNDGDLEQDILLEAGVAYIISFEVSGMTQGELCYDISNSNGDDNAEENGFFEDFFTTDEAGTHSLNFFDCDGSGGDFDGTLDNISVKETFWDSEDDGWEISDNKATHTPTTGAIVDWDDEDSGDCGYQENDVLTVDGGDGNATLTVTEVDGDDCIEDMEITTAGTGYEDGEDYELTGGNGTGAEIFDIDVDNTGSLDQLGGLEDGASYQVTFTIGGTEGSVEVCLGEGDCEEFDAGDGNISSIMLWEDSSEKIIFVPSPDFDGTIENVSVKKVQDFSVAQSWYDSFGSELFRIDNAGVHLEQLSFENGDNIFEIGSGGIFADVQSDSSIIDIRHIMTFDPDSDDPNAFIKEILSIDSVGAGALDYDVIGHDIQLYNGDEGGSGASGIENTIAIRGLNFEHTGGNIGNIIGVLGESNMVSNCDCADFVIGVKGMAGSWLGGADENTNLVGAALYASAPGGHTSIFGKAVGLWIEEQAGDSFSAYQIYSEGTAPSYFAGNVGIGTEEPDEKLHVVGNALIEGALTVDSCTGCADYAEAYEAENKSDLEAGDVLSINEEGKVIKGDVSHTVIGIYSTAPGMLIGSENGINIGGENKTLKDNEVPVALSGRVPVKFSSENGEVNSGDRLVLSSTLPGFAVKQTSSGSSIGIALESSSNQDTVLTFINLSYQFAGDITLPSDTTTDLEDEGFISSLFSKISVWLGKVENGISLLYATVIKSQRVETETLCVGATCVTEAEFIELLNGNGVESVSTEVVEEEIVEPEVPPEEESEDPPEVVENAPESEETVLGN